MNFTFGADKRLKSRKSIERLFSEGKKLYKHPITVIYVIEKNALPTFQIAVSVPKRNFKKAVDRNELKRKMREAARLHQDKLFTMDKLQLMLIYTSSEKLNYKEIEKSIMELFGRLSSTLDEQNENR